MLFILTFTESIYVKFIREYINLRNILNVHLLEKQTSYNDS